MSLTYTRLSKESPDYECTKTLYNGEFPDSNVEIEFDYFMDVLERIAADVYVYRSDDEYAGYSITIPGKHHVYYYMIAVSPALRSNGIGGQIASLVRSMYPDKSLTGLVEADDPSPEGRKIQERRLAFHARNGLKKTGYHLHIHSRDYLLISTADTFDPADLQDISEKLASSLKDAADGVSLVWVGD